METSTKASTFKVKFIQNIVFSKLNIFSQFRNMATKLGRSLDPRTLIDTLSWISRDEKLCVKYFRRGRVTLFRGGGLSGFGLLCESVFSNFCGD